MQSHNWIDVIRWTARLLSIASVGLLLLFLFGGEERLSAVTTREIVALALFPFGLMAGLLLAWRYELAGGSVSVASLLAFYVFLGLEGSLPRGPWFVLFTLPGFLFLIGGICSRSYNRSVEV